MNPVATKARRVAGRLYATFVGSALQLGRGQHVTLGKLVVGQRQRLGGFGSWMRDAAKAAGLPVGVSHRGLRKAAARRLAEAGASAHQIQAITGHKTLKEVERYTREAAQARLAQSAIALVGGTEPEQDSAKPSVRLDKSASK